jgi:cytidine deaminase
MTDRELFDLAVKAMDNAYVPYSHYRVGAALLSEDGRVFTGCNVENASYGGTICAERTAIVKAVSEGATKFTAIAVAGEDADAWPCGICRQVMNEFSKDLRVICGARKTGKFTAVPLKELLPRAFGPEDLI